MCFCAYESNHIEIQKIFKNIYIKGAILRKRCALINNAVIVTPSVYLQTTSYASFAALLCFFIPSLEEILDPTYH